MTSQRDHEDWLDTLFIEGVLDAPMIHFPNGTCVLIPGMMPLWCPHVARENALLEYAVRDRSEP